MAPPAIEPLTWTLFQYFCRRAQPGAFKSCNEGDDMISDGPVCIDSRTEKQEGIMKSHRVRQWASASVVSLLAVTYANSQESVFRCDAAVNGLADITASEAARGERYVLAILWDYNKPDEPPEVPASVVTKLLNGDSSSVVGYYLANSHDSLTIKFVDILGWYDADHPWTFYWAPQDTFDRNGDGFISGHVAKWAEGIRKADQIFDFKRFDRNGDGRLDPQQELAVLFIMPGGPTPFGTVRVPAGREYPTWEPLVVDGVSIPLLAEAYIGSLANLGVLNHELAHLLFGSWDMYFSFYCPYAAGPYSLMDVCYTDAHLDPIHKMKLGWLNTTVIGDSGRYEVAAVESSAHVYVLVDSTWSDKEYFIIENRQRGLRYDTALPDSGLAIWHVMTDPTVYQQLLPPPSVSASNWLSVSPTDWGRRGIRLIRPISGPPLDNNKALWDGSDSTTGYDLLSWDSNPAHAQLRWHDGRPSGFAIREISPSGFRMKFTIDVPVTSVYVDRTKKGLLPEKFTLEQNFPNPFNPGTTIQYALPYRSRVTLTIYNTLGQLVVTLVSDDIEAGYHTVQFDASNLATGVYFYRMQAGDFVQTRKLILMK